MKRIFAGIDWFGHLRDSDPKAFNHLFELYYPRIFSYTIHILGQDPEVTDIVMRTFALMWERRDTYENLDHLQGSLYIMTRNACISRLRALAAGRKARKEFNYLAEKLEGRPDLEQVYAEIAAMLPQHIAWLPENQQQVLDLFYYKGMTIGEIAAELGIHYETVATRKSRAIAALRASLGKSRPSIEKRSFFL